MTIGQKIKYYRENSHWSQEELAKKLGVSVSAIGMIETDKRNVKDNLKFKLCDLFNISIAELMSSNTIDFEILKNKIVSVFIKNKTKNDIFNEVIKETINIIEETQYIELIKVRCNFIETREILKNIYHFYFNYLPKYEKVAIPRGEIFTELYKEQTIDLLKKINYKNINFENSIVVYPEIIIGSEIEKSISKDFYNDKDCIGIKISTNKMSPKYEKGNTLIIQNSKEFYSGQDVCFKDKSRYKIGRAYVQDNIAIIKYLNNEYDIEFFNIAYFKKLLIGTVVSVLI